MTASTCLPVLLFPGPHVHVVITVVRKLFILISYLVCTISYLVCTRYDDEDVGLARCERPPLFFILMDTFRFIITRGSGVAFCKHGRVS